MLSKEIGDTGRDSDILGEIADVYTEFGDLEKAGKVCLLPCMNIALMEHIGHYTNPVAFRTEIHGIRALIPCISLDLSQTFVPAVL